MSSSEPVSRELVAVAIVGDVRTACLPPLYSGDHLDQPTFHARYEAMPADFRAELVEGVVIVSSPTSPDHAGPHGLVVTWLFTYHIATAGTKAFDNVSNVLDDSSEFQPDGMLLIETDYGGQAEIDERWVRGSPDLIAEVAFSSESFDLHSKRRVYEQAGVREYLVVLLRERRVIWFLLSDGRYQELHAGADGILRSVVFPGLWLDPAALLANDGGAVMDALRRGIEDPHHAEFIERLRSNRARLSDT